MRRSLTAIAASVLLLSSVGTAAGAEPGASAGPAPIVEPTPSVAPPPGSDPAPDPSSEADPPTPPSADPILRPGPRPDGQTIAPVVQATAPSVTTPATAHPDRRADTDPTDRWIVLLKPGADVTTTVARQTKRMGFATDRTYRNAVRGYSAKLERAQVTALSHDSSVAMIVADERIETEAQVMPTGISRVGATGSVVAAIDGIDERVDADVAIVDTGIKAVADLNVVGGYNCSTSNRAASVRNAQWSSE